MFKAFSVLTKQTSFYFDQFGWWRAEKKETDSARLPKAPKTVHDAAVFVVCHQIEWIEERRFRSSRESCR